MTALLYLATITDAADFGAVLDQRLFRSRFLAQAWADSRAEFLTLSDEHPDGPVEPRVSVTTVPFSEETEC
jgi:hypothetical protein